MLKRSLDILVSGIGLLLLSPFFLLICLLIVLDSRGPAFYRQVRVGRNGRDFRLWKLRTMYIDSDKRGQLITIGNRDARVTRLGYYLRKYKLDEFPQLINVLKGEMSLVGPRPEVRKYVNYYTPEQLKVLDVRPGITDPASIAFADENQILEAVADPEQYYIKEVMPRKLELNLVYIRRQNFWRDIGILFKTAAAIFSKK